MNGPETNSKSEIAKRFITMLLTSLPGVMKTGLANILYVSQLPLSISLVYCVVCLICRFIFSCFAVRSSVEVDVDRITVYIPPPPPTSLPLSLFFFWGGGRTHNSLCNAIDSYLKSVRAYSWFRCRLAVYF